MQMSALYKTLGLALSAVLVSACSSNSMLDASDTETETKEASMLEASSENTDVESNAVDSDSVSGEAVMEEEAESAAEAMAASLREMTVFYFDFDESSVKSAAKEALAAHAAFLANNPSMKVVLEGHADERGTPEYNLALGDRRGMSVRQYLLANGASSSQIKVVSYGEERPVATGHTESSWAKNRRVELKYQN